MSIWYNECDEPFVCLSYDGDIIFDSREFTKIHFKHKNILFCDSIAVDVVTVLSLLHSMFYWVIYLGAYNDGEFNTIELATCFALLLSFIVSAVTLSHMLYKRYIVTAVKNEITNKVHNHSYEKHSICWRNEKIEKMLQNVCSALGIVDIYTPQDSAKMFAKIYSPTKLALYITVFLMASFSAITEFSRTDMAISAIQNTRSVSISEIYSYMNRNNFVYYAPTDTFYKKRDFENYMNIVRQAKINAENVKFEKQPLK